MPGDVVVIGAGLAGLASALRLGRRATVLEASGAVGGLCRSYSREGFTFDIAGHLLHFRRAATRRFVSELFPVPLARHSRRAFVHFRGRLVRFPFQAHLHELPPKVRDECLEGFRSAPGRTGAEAPADLESWLRHQFGEGIFRHFLEPYNRKMWRAPLAAIDAAWASWAVPVPTAAQIEEAARPGGAVQLGYNPVFHYPREGGIGALAAAMARGDFGLRLGERAVGVDLRRRRVETASGRVYPFEHLVSTVPLPELLRMTRGLPPAVVEAGARLRAVAICVFNVGLARPAGHAAHWVYFPGRGFPFYRAGIATNFAPSCAPAGHHGLYVEATLPPGRAPGCADLWPAVRSGLERAGLLLAGEQPAVLDRIHVPCAYVLYDRHRSRVLPGIHAALRSRGVHAIGRYGAWEYSSMEDALRQGAEAARSLGGGRAKSGG